MVGIELLKVALEEGVKVLPTHFLKDNNIKAKYLGDKHCVEINENALTRYAHSLITRYNSSL